MKTHILASRNRCGSLDVKPELFTHKTTFLTMASFMLLTSLVVLLPVAASAQVLNEITVTAYKRETLIQDTSVSVTAFSGDQIKQLGFTNSVDIVNQTPGLTFGTPTAEGNNASITLRGVGLNDFNDNNEGPVAVYVDETYMSALSGVTFQLFDLERVEVLRGPQGTLYGRNTTGGIIKFITKKPTKDLEAYGEFTYGSNDQKKWEAAIGGALSDKVMVRVSGAGNKFDGYVKNLNPGHKNPNDADNIAGRIQVMFEPSETFNVLVNIHASEDDSLAGSFQHQSTFADAAGVSLALPDSVDFYGTCPCCDAFGYKDTDGSPWKGSYDRDGRLDIQNRGASATINWDLQEGVTLTSVSAYEHFERFYEEDTDQSPFPLINPTFSASTDQFTQELRIAGERERLHWTGGFYFFNQQVDGSPDLDLTGLGFINLDVTYKQKTTSWSFFGQGEYDLTDKLTLIGGARFTHENKTLDYLSVDTTGCCGPVGFVFNKAVNGSLAEQKNDNGSGRVGLDYRPNEDLLLYVSVSRGTKSAGFNTGLLDSSGTFGSNTPGEIPYKAEKLTSYEAGFKITMFDGKARVNASGFYYDYKNFQAFTFENLSQLILNADAKVAGAEAEITLNPIEGLDMLFGVSYLPEAKAKNISDSLGVKHDRRMVLAPKVQLNGLVRYEYPIDGLGSLAAQVDASYQNKTFFDIQNHPVSSENGYDIWNFRITYYSPDKRWELGGFVQNAFQEQYKLYTFDFTSLFGFNQQAFGRPRWWGVRAAAHL